MHEVGPPGTFHGIIPYLVSPVTATGSLLIEPLEQLVEDLIVTGVHGLTPLGSSGEFAYLSNEQRARVVDTVIRIADGRVPVIPGVAGAATVDAARQAEHYVRLGASGVVLAMSSYFPPTDRSASSFFIDVAASIDVPVVIYTNPALQGYSLSMDVIERILTQAPNVQYIKDASGYTARLQSLRRTFGNRIGIFAATAHLPVSVLQLGGLGIMSGPACLAPRLLLELYRSYRSGNLTHALMLQEKISELSDLFLQFKLASCLKAGLGILGYEVGEPVLPQEPLTPHQVSRLREVLLKLQA